jgi:hypothetical protein
MMVKDSTDVARDPAEVIKRLWAERQPKQPGRVMPPLGKDGKLPPGLPESCWKGLFADYRELVAPTTEAPDSYHFASFAVVVGALLGRRVWVHYANRLYPNIYTVLAGTSGLPRKSTSWSRGRDLVDALQDASDPTAKPSVQVIHGTGSAEGLLDALDGNSRVVVMVSDEFRTLLGKGKQEGSILVPCLTELFSCRDYRLQTRQKTVVAVEPFMSIVANTTISWLEQSLAENDILGGFAGRFLYVIGEPKGPLPYPPKPDKARFDSLVKSLNECRAFADEVAKSGGELVPSNEAKATFAEYYRQHRRHCEDENLQTTLLRRLPDYCWKLALLYASLDKSRVIDVDHITPAIEAVQFFEGCTQRIFATFGESKTLRLERRLEEMLKATPERTMRARDLQRKLGIDARYFGSICDAMEREAIIHRVETRNDLTGKSTLYVTLL